MPEAFTDAKDPAVKAEFQKTNAAVIASLHDYEHWLKTDLLPRSKGDFRIGADTFSKKLLYDEMVDTPLDEAARQSPTPTCTRTRLSLSVSRKRWIASKTPKEVLAELASIHPAPDQLLPTFHEHVRRTDPFIRQSTSSRFHPTYGQRSKRHRPSCGPRRRHRWILRVLSRRIRPRPTSTSRLPEKDWTAEHIAEHMAAFNVGTIISTSVHEAYPGHYVQFLWMNHADLSQVRKLDRLRIPTSRAGPTTVNR